VDAGGQFHVLAAWFC